MKNLATILFAGALVATAAFAQINDNGANMRFHMKTGRDLPGVVAQIQPPAQCCSMAACQMKAAPTVAHTDADQRFYAKNGRYTPAEEARLQTPATSTVATAMPAPTDAADRFHAKTGRSLAVETTQLASASASDCGMMGCCRRHS